MTSVFPISYVTAHSLWARNEKAPKNGKNAVSNLIISCENQDTEWKNYIISTLLMLSFLKKSDAKMKVFAFNSPLTNLHSLLSTFVT